MSRTLLSITIMLPCAVIVSWKVVLIMLAKRFMLHATMALSEHCLSVNESTSQISSGFTRKTSQPGNNLQPFL